MIARIESHRNKPPLPVAAALFHELERATRATDAAHDSGNEDRAAGLLAHRNVIVQQIVGTTAGGAA